MHQQVRCSIRRTDSDAAFGRLDNESLVEILTLLQVHEPPVSRPHPR